MDIKLQELKQHIARGWRIFPCNGKAPLTEHGFKDATSDESQIEAWHRKHPCANWAVATGDDSAFVIDQDAGGEGAWEELQAKHGAVETLTVRTPRGGFHYYLQRPGDGACRCTTSRIGPGIDTRGNGGYALLPPSEDYHWYSNPNAAIAPCPRWIVAALAKPETKPGVPQVTDGDRAQDILKALQALQLLPAQWADDYQHWVEVGFSLRELGDEGLRMWQAWSGKSKKFKAGECIVKWESMEPAGITLGSLIHWGREHSPAIIPAAPRDAKPSDLRKTLAALGFSFTLHDGDDGVFVNGYRLSDPMLAHLHDRLFELGYKNFGMIDNCIVATALEHPFHPARDYINGLKWDGQDHINNLALFFQDKHGLFAKYLRYWLIGAVARLKAGPFGCQNRMMILVGPQSIGKSFFVRWLGSPVPEMRIEAPIILDGSERKDSLVRLMNTFVWEVAEFGATYRRADREALKFFISMQTVAIRKPYGHFDTRKPAISSFVATVNNESGFLNDATGYRRFLVCELTSILWDYATEIDVSQVWAQAVHLFNSGEQWELRPEDHIEAEDIAQQYEVDNPGLEYLLKYFDFDPANKTALVTTAEIIRVFRDNEAMRDNDNAIAQKVASAMTRLNAEQVRIRRKKQQLRAWVGFTRAMM